MSSAFELIVPPVNPELSENMGLRILHQRPCPNARRTGASIRTARRVLENATDGSYPQVSREDKLGPTDRAAVFGAMIPGMLEPGAAPIPDHLPLGLSILRFFARCKATGPQ